LLTLGGLWRPVAGEPSSQLSTAPDLGETETVVLPGGATLRMLWVPAATFRMGTAEGARGDGPCHAVSLTGYWIGVTEVTVAQWRSVVGTPSWRNDQGDDHPVMDVSWDACQAFGAKTGLALPTEAQWEYAARGPAGRRYPWGETWQASLCQCWQDRHGRQGTAPAGSLPAGASWCGALDMAGNVFEWCRDGYDEGFYASPASCGPNPECRNARSGKRVLRGGCWGSSPDNCRSDMRYQASPEFRNAGVGFRVCAAG